VNSPTRFAVKLPIGTMRDLLLARKETLEIQIAERFAHARENGAPQPDVRTLSAILRTVKHQLAGLAGVAGVGDG